MTVQATPTRRLRLLCPLTVLAILVCGLWPFRRPANDAAWVGYRNGIHFGGLGIAYASGPLQGVEPSGGACSLEVWLRPDKTEQSGTIVEFYNPAAPSEFSLFQERSSMGFRLHNQRRPEGPNHYDRTGGVFRSGEPVFFTIASDSKATVVYVNGVPAKTMPDFPLARWNLEGQLVTGAWATADGGWAGELLGLATYARLLAPADVVRHYRTWVSEGKPESVTPAGCLALYLFDERSGRVARYAFGTGADLTLPERDAMMRKPFLAWTRPHRSDWSDILLNIAGFAPLGLFFQAYFARALSTKKAALAAILLGAVMSLGIELRQAYLPGRASDLRDLTLNVLGAAAGVFLCGTRSAQRLLAKTGLLS